MRSPTTPTSKVTAAGVGGAVAVLISWVLGLFGIDLPPEAAAAIALLLSAGAGYVTRERRVPHPPPANLAS